jgi:protein subunit release factor A
MKIAIEIRPGEGGRDAELLVERQAAIYIRHLETQGANIEILETGR